MSVRDGIICVVDDAYDVSEFCSVLKFVSVKYCKCEMTRKQTEDRLTDENSSVCSRLKKNLKISVIQSRYPNSL